MGTPALEGIIGMGAATKIGGAKAHGPNIGWHVPARGPGCETGRERAHLRSGRRTDWRVFFEQAEQAFFPPFFRFAFSIFPDFSAALHFSCPRFHFAFFLSAISFHIFTSRRSHFKISAP